MLRKKLAPKVIGFLLAVCFGISLVTGWISYQNGKSALEESSFNQLTAIREIKRNQVRKYFDLIEAQIQTLSQSQMTIDAMREYKSSFSEISLQESISRTGLETVEPGGALFQHYQQEFLPKLEGGLQETRALEDLLPTSKTAIYLQHHYIALNPAALGGKDQMRNAGDGSRYSEVHEKYHHIFQSYLQKFDYRDIFLIDDKTGEIVYSVFKETDYATNLLIGRFKHSNIADVFLAVRALEDPEDVKFTDFQYYEPSYGAPAAFVGSPIYEDGQRIGVLIFQLPVQRLNEIMTGGQNWINDGLGTSGETYLVGPDKSMRSMSRFLIEDRDGYFEELRKLSYSEKNIQQLANFNTSILLQKVETQAAERAMMGETETAIIDDYRGISVLSSYAPIQYGDARWAIISEIDAAEAFAPVVKLSRDLAVSALVISFGVGFLSVLVAGRFIDPIRALADAAEAVSYGNTKIALPVKSEDEIGHLTENFNQMVVNLREQREAIEQQIMENTKLLLNVLPPPVAERLKSGEKRIADSYPNASIIFTDLVGFTAWSQGLPAMDVLTMLDQLFGAFDEKAKELGVEKIKTMGDAYMAVCGLPTPNENHPQIMAELALSMMEEFQAFSLRNGTELKMRVGLHCGPVVAGVIGTSKFIYDLWGESVNMASRMESTGIPNQIQISERFHRAIGDQYKTELRGEIIVKGAGKVKTYILHGRLEPSA